MADILENDKTLDTPLETQDASETPSPGEVESLAAELGWRPEGELDAKSYILKSRDIQDTMRDHINTQKKQLGELGSSVAELKLHNERVYKAELKRKDAEIQALKDERKDAIHDGDVDKVEELDGKINDLKEELSTPKTAAPATTAFDEWVEKNDWYKKDSEMRDLADKIADENDGAPFKTIARLVDLEVRRTFPDKFKSKKTVPPSPVEGAGKRTVTAKFTKADLTDSQKTIMRQFVNQGIMTEAQYIKDIAVQQGVV